MSSALLTVLTELLAEYLEREGSTDELEFGAAAAELMQSLIFHNRHLPHFALRFRPCHEAAERR